MVACCRVTAIPLCFCGSILVLCMAPLCTANSCMSATGLLLVMASPYCYDVITYIEYFVPIYWVIRAMYTL